MNSGRCEGFGLSPKYKASFVESAVMNRLIWLIHVILFNRYNSLKNEKLSGKHSNLNLLSKFELFPFETFIFSI